MITAYLLASVVMGSFAGLLTIATGGTFWAAMGAYLLWGHVAMLILAVTTYMRRLS